MRKLDKFILNSFFGPFLLTTGLATFVLLIQYMMKYFDDFVGKNLGFSVFAELIMYFSLNMLQVALPLGVLVSSLMTFGNLGEHFELTAIKSAGISLVRALQPIFFFVIVLTYGAYNFNNYVVPAANLKAYSLLYDIKHKKPALDIKPGMFYGGIPDYSIKVKEKLPDNKTLKEVLIYDHTEGPGNRRVIIADSSLMYTMYNDKYLKLELYNGNYYSEEEKKKEPINQLFRSQFHRMDLVFSLSSFDLQRTKEELFENNRQMKNISELDQDIDSLRETAFDARTNCISGIRTSYLYATKDRFAAVRINPWTKKIEVDSISKPPARDSISEASMFSFLSQLTPKLERPATVILPDSLLKPRKNLENQRKTASQDLNQMRVAKSGVKGVKTPVMDDSVVVKSAPVGFPTDSLTWEFLDRKSEKKKLDILLNAKNHAQNIKVNLSSASSRVDGLERDVNRWIIEKHKKYSQAFACIVMFLIGAPLGAIIKKGGLGVPVIVSISFFLLFYVITIMCEKYAKEGLMDPALAPWMGNLILLPFGFFFLRQARIDARLFETDFYLIWIDRIKERFFKRSV